MPETCNPVDHYSVPANVKALGKFGDRIFHAVGFGRLGWIKVRGRPNGICRFAERGESAERGGVGGGRGRPVAAAGRGRPCACRLRADGVRVRGQELAADGLVSEPPRAAAAASEPREQQPRPGPTCPGPAWPACEVGRLAVRGAPPCRVGVCRISVADGSPRSAVTFVTFFTFRKVGEAAEC